MNTKRRRIGIRVKEFPSAVAHPALGAVQLFDVESGEEIAGVEEVTLTYSVKGAITANLTIFVAAVEVIGK